MTFGGLFNTVATAAGAPPGAELTPAQRLGAISAAIAERRRALGPLGRSAGRPGFPRALRPPARRPPGRRARARRRRGGGGDPRGVRLPRRRRRPVRRLRRGPRPPRDGRQPRHRPRGDPAAGRVRRASGAARPVFLYGLDDLTPNQLDLIRALAAATEVTVALPYEEGNLALAARPALLEGLREIGVESETATAADPDNTPSPSSSTSSGTSARSSRSGWRPTAASSSCAPRASAARPRRSRAEVVRLLADGSDPSEIAIVLRDPAAARAAARLGARVLRGPGRPRGRGPGRRDRRRRRADRDAGDDRRHRPGPPTCSATCGWPPASPPGSSTPSSARSAAAGSRARAPRSSSGKSGSGTCRGDLARARETAARPADLAAEVARAAATIAARGSDLEQSAAAVIASALAERAELGELAAAARSARPGPRRARGPGLARPRRGPGADRRPLPPAGGALRPRHRRLPAGRRVPAPRRPLRPVSLRGPARHRSASSRGATPTPRSATCSRACLALPRRRLFLSYRDSDENGVAEARSPLLDQVRRLLDPPPGEERPDAVEVELTRGRDLAQVVCRPGDAPSEKELARAIAARGPDRGRRRAARDRRRPGGGLAATRRASSPARARSRRRPGRRGRSRTHRPRAARLGLGLRRHDARGVRRLLLPLVRLPRAQPPGPRPRLPTPWPRAA